ncbi:MAG: hypothetical protein J7L25_08940 [Deltaproteobacteria bacterium]|nr:hypothetical protein [Candidatus Tharpella aukensis]
MKSSDLLRRSGFSDTRHTICMVSRLKNHYLLHPKGTSCGAYIEIFT